MLSVIPPKGHWKYALLEDAGRIAGKKAKHRTPRARRFSPNALLFWNGRTYTLLLDGKGRFDTMDERTLMAVFESRHIPEYGWEWFDAVIRGDI